MRFAIIVSLLFVTSVAEAQIVPPGICDAPSEAALFVLGVRKGRNLAEQVIARATTPGEVCADLEALGALRATVEATIATVHVPPGASEAVQCHAAGQMAGLIDQFQAVQDECTGACIGDGLLAGEIGGALYCGLAIALEGLGAAEVFARLPTSACGTHFQVACETGLVTRATGEAACLPYTQGAHAEAYAAARNNACAHNPE
jgi:hypothetical protein